ncbi:TetR/AcrR family transcriptional regulator [Carnobacterium gallinarum]|uniref:TetR/AcrR family transcriptional regulator n=1 Tax=Carnobacterium gallinarum TaxID=2749 RepID=UPI0005536407|nr:TetR/AcrR family transcriptional regulator [Carnobacterium gallinarum]
MKKNKVTKERIIASAISVADQKGLQQITLKDVAAILDIKTPSLYNHIAGLDDLVNLLAYDGLTKLKNQLINAVLGLSGKEALFSMGMAYRNFAKESPSLYEATQLVHLWKNKETQQLAESIVELMSIFLESYHFSNEKKISIIRMLRSYLHGFSLLEMQQSFGMPLNIDKSFQFGLSTILNSLDNND